MAYIKKPPELVSRSIKLEQPTNELLDEYARFVECTRPCGELCPEEDSLARPRIQKVAGGPEKRGAGQAPQ
jgi:hypothetical protein